MILKNQPRTALAVAVTLILLGAAPAVRADLSFTAAQQPADALAYTSGGAWVNYQAINNNGDIAGQISADGEAHYLGFVNNNVLNYGAFNTGLHSSNFDVASINNSGDIIGTYLTNQWYYATPSAYPTQAGTDIYGDGSTVQSVTQAPTNTISTADAISGGISNNGVALGGLDNNNHIWGAVTEQLTASTYGEYIAEGNSTGSSYTNYEVLTNTAGSSLMDGTNLQVTGVSEQGTYVTGDFVNTSGVEVSFIFNTSTGQFQEFDLGALANGTQAAGVNDSGEVVGTAFTSSGESGFIWENGKFIMTGIVSPFDPGYGTSTTYTYLTGINDGGTIIGNSANSGASFTATASAVPLPGGFWLMSTALAGLGMLRRLKAKA